MPPEAEISPVPRGNERVVFRSHFLRGFGLPASGFLRSFLEFYNLQPHEVGVGQAPSLAEEFNVVLMDVGAVP